MGTQLSFSSLGSPAWPSASAASKTRLKFDFVHRLGIEDLDHAVRDSVGIAGRRCGSSTTADPAECDRSAPRRGPARAAVHRFPGRPISHPEIRRCAPEPCPHKIPASSNTVSRQSGRYNFPSLNSSRRRSASRDARAARCQCSWKVRCQKRSVSPRLTRMPLSISSSFEEAWRRRVARLPAHRGTWAPGFGRPQIG
jgi:hypothetical protein